MSAADAIRSFITPLLPGWRVQFGRWVDGLESARFAVLRPAGGLPAELVRQPQFTLALIGAKNESAAVAEAAADALIEAMRLSSGSLVFLQPAEPVYMPTNDGRPVFELAISAITN
jgi:hypothetical protein